MKCQCVFNNDSEKAINVSFVITTLRMGSSNCGDHLVWVIFFGVMVIDYDLDIDVHRIHRCRPNLYLFIYLL